MKRQLTGGGATSAINALGSSAQAVTVGALVGSTIMNVVMSGALAQVWGMINGMQIMVHLPALAVKFPANAFMVVEQILQIATFDFPYIDVETLSGGFFAVSEDDAIFTDIPEEKALELSDSFDQLSYGSRYMSRNLGSVYILFIISFGILVLTFFFWMFSKCCGCSERAFKKLDGKFAWNFYIRLVLEASLELSFSCIINLKYGNVFKYPESPTIGSIFNFVVAIIFSVLVLASPLVILIAYNYHFLKLNVPEFEERYGAVYEGLKHCNRSVLLYPVIFVARRIIFGLVAVFFYDFVWLQLAIQIHLTIFAACYLVEFKPFSDPLVQKLEVFNEVVGLSMTNLLFCFTDLIHDEEMNYAVGYIFIGLLVFNICTHLYFMFRGICINMRTMWKRNELLVEQKGVTRAKVGGCTFFWNTLKACFTRKKTDEAAKEKVEEEKSQVENKSELESPSKKLVFDGAMPRPQGLGADQALNSGKSVKEIL